MSKNAILDRDLRREINSHEQKHKLADGITDIAKSFKEIFSKVLDTKKKVAAPALIIKSAKTEEASSTPTDKIIDPNIKARINDDPNSEIIKSIVSEITPSLITSIDAASKIPVTSSSSPIASPVLSPISSANSLSSPVIDEKVRVDINKHPFKDAIKASINNFAQKFLPIIQQAINKEARIIAISSEKFIESKIKGPQGEEIARLFSSGVITVGQLANQASLSSTKLIDSDTKDQINAHPFRDIILQFLNSVLPKILNLVGEVIVVGGGLGGKLIDGVIEKVIPRSAGREIGTAAEHLIEAASKGLAGKISTITIHEEQHTTLVMGEITDGHHA